MDCPHDEFSFDANISGGSHGIYHARLSLKCKACGAPFKWLPFLAVEASTGDVLLSAHVSEPLKVVPLIPAQYPFDEEG